MRIVGMNRGKLAGVLCWLVAFGVAVSGCSKNPKKSTCTQFELVSSKLLETPVFSPIDSCIYYSDRRADSAYFDEFRRNQSAEFWPTTQQGIYRLKLHDDSPAELVAPEGWRPSISPDASTMYYNIGYWGGTIMKVQLPDGQPELVKEGSFIRVCWYSPDTLVVGTGLGGGWGTYFLDLKTDSLHPLESSQLGGHFDVGPDGRIAHGISLGGVGVYDPRDSTSITITNSGGRNPSWSPNGKEIVYAHQPSGGGSEIRVTDLDGHERILAVGGNLYNQSVGSVYSPNFTSDGKYIIYIKNTTPLDYDPYCKYDNLIQDGQIWIMSAADGSGKRQVSNWSRIRP